MENRLADSKFPPLSQQPKRERNKRWKNKWSTLFNKIYFYIPIKRKAAFFNRHGKSVKIIVTENEQFWKEQADQVTSSNDHTVMFKLHGRVYEPTKRSQRLLHAGYCYLLWTSRGPVLPTVETWGQTTVVPQQCHGNHKWLVCSRGHITTLNS